MTPAADLAKRMREWFDEDTQEDRSVAIFTAGALLRDCRAHIAREKP